VNAGDSLGGPEDGLGRLADALADGRLDAAATPESLAAEFGVPREAAERALRAARALASALDDGVAWEGGAPGAADDERPELPADFELLDRIGQGGMGVVWRARQKSLDRVVAVKVLRPGERTFGPALRRFEREARALARLRHPHVVAVHEVGAVNGGVYFTMDFVDGRSLAAEFAEGPATPSRAVRVLKQIASAVAWVHAQGFLHRDLKPGNVLLDRAGDAFVGDFGLAVDRTSDARVTQTGALVGTPAYLAPELATGRTPGATEASDVYGLGAILFEALTGRAPYVGGNAAEVLAAVVGGEPPRVRSLRRDCPAELAAIAEKALARSPADRYATARALLEDLERFEAGRPVHARPPSFARRASAFARRHRGRIVAAAAGVVAAALVAYAVFAPRLRLPAEELVRRARTSAEQGDEGAAAMLFDQAAESDPAEAATWRAEALRLRVAQVEGLLQRGRPADAERLATSAAAPFADAASIARRIAAVHVPADDPAADVRPRLLLLRARALHRLGRTAETDATLDLGPPACLIAAAARGGEPGEVGVRYDEAADRWFAEIAPVLANDADELRSAVVAASLRTLDPSPSPWSGAPSFGWAFRTLPVRRDASFAADVPAWFALEAARLRAGGNPLLDPRIVEGSTRLFSRKVALAVSEFARRPAADAADVRAAAFFVTEARDLPVRIDVSSRPADARLAAPRPTDAGAEDAAAALDLFRRAESDDPVRTTAQLRAAAFELAKDRRTAPEALRWLSRWTAFERGRGGTAARRDEAAVFAAELGDEDPRLSLRRALRLAIDDPSFAGLKSRMERASAPDADEAARLHRLLLLATPDDAARPVEGALRANWRHAAVAWRRLLDGRDDDGEDFKVQVLSVAFGADDAPVKIRHAVSVARGGERGHGVVWHERTRSAPLAGLGVATPGGPESAIRKPSRPRLAATKSAYGRTPRETVTITIDDRRADVLRNVGEIGAAGVGTLRTIAAASPADLYGLTIASADPEASAPPFREIDEARRTIAATALRAAEDREARRRAEPHRFATPDKGDPDFALARLGALFPLPEALDAWVRLDATTAAISSPTGRLIESKIRHFLPAALLAGAPWPQDLDPDVLVLSADLLLTGSADAGNERAVFWARLAVRHPAARELAAKQLAVCFPSDGASAAHAVRLLGRAGLAAPAELQRAAARPFGGPKSVSDQTTGAAILALLAALVVWAASGAAAIAAARRRMRTATRSAAPYRTRADRRSCSCSRGSSFSAGSFRRRRSATPSRWSSRTVCGARRERSPVGFAAAAAPFAIAAAAAAEVFRAQRPSPDPVVVAVCFALSSAAIGSRRRAGGESASAVDERLRRIALSAPSSERRPPRRSAPRYRCSSMSRTARVTAPAQALRSGPSPRLFSCCSCPAPWARTRASGGRRQRTTQARRPSARPRPRVPTRPVRGRRTSAAMTVRAGRGVAPTVARTDGRGGVDAGRRSVPRRTKPDMPAIRPTPLTSTSPLWPRAAPPTRGCGSAATARCRATASCCGCSARSGRTRTRHSTSRSKSRTNSASRCARSSGRCPSIRARTCARTRSCSGACRTSRATSRSAASASRSGRTPTIGSRRSSRRRGRRSSSATKTRCANRRRGATTSRRG
jgi:hypothetical protein